MSEVPSLPLLSSSLHSFCPLQGTELATTFCLAEGQTECLMKLGGYYPYKQPRFHGVEQLQASPFQGEASSEQRGLLYGVDAVGAEFKNRASSRTQASEWRSSP